MAPRINHITGFDHDFGRHKKTALVVRYGGIGDMIQASSVMHVLKREGWRTAVNCDQLGEKVLRHHPHIDELWVQKKDQIPVKRLPEYWQRMADAFGRFHNLTGSVEVGLLVLPDQPEFRLPKAERHARFNVNYLERTHDLVGVEHDYDARFYATAAENAWARKEVRKFATSRHTDAPVPVVLISLSGSSVHKAYPHMDRVIGDLLARTPATVVTVGDKLCSWLEAGWERQPRVKMRSGRYTLRRVLALAEHVDVVVGTETGILNAVGMRDVAKVLMLSHSSVENLSKHWVNVRNIIPYLAECHPCHKLHHRSFTCPRGKVYERAALCADSIRPREVFEAICESVDVMPLAVRAA